jgi:hypothetical protein
MTGYGAVDNRPKSGVVVGAVVGVVLLAAAIGGVIFFQTSESQKRDEMDAPALEAEHAAIAKVTTGLERLAAAAVPETPPEQYAGLLAAAREAYAAHVAAPRRTSPLPSGRAWPMGFAAAEEHAKDALDRYGALTHYLGLREKIVMAKDPKRTTASVDNDIENVSRLAGAELAKAREALEPK